MRKGTTSDRVILPKLFYERPLTQREAEFAGDNIDLVWKYLHYRGLDRSEWFDVVIFRYLLAVKRWFSLPELQETSTFVTVAWTNMMSAIGNEQDKQKNRPQTVSLFDVIPGTDGLLYIDVLGNDGPEIRER